MKRIFILRGIKALLIVVLAISAFGYAVMSLWNWVVPPVTGWHALNFAQAIALLVLSRILFGGFRRHGWRWRHHLRERWEHMTPSERERFRASYGDRCGGRGRQSSATEV
jgi:hypothetical protein